MCSDLINKRDDTIKNEEYIIQDKMGDYFVGDTWDIKNDTSLKDSPQRVSTTPAISKSELELKVEELEARIIELENKLTELEV